MERVETPHDETGCDQQHHGESDLNRRAATIACDTDRPPATVRLPSFSDSVRFTTLAWRIGAAAHSSVAIAIVAMLNAATGQSMATSSSRGMPSGASTTIDGDQPLADQ